MGAEAVGQVEVGQLHVVKAKGALAVFAIKVQVAVVVVASPLLVAQFVVDNASSVLKGVHHVVL
mgnify:FL=1